MQMTSQSQYRDQLFSSNLSGGTGQNVFGGSGGTSNYHSRKQSFNDNNNFRNKRRPSGDNHALTVPGTGAKFGRREDQQFNGGNQANNMM